MEPGSWICSNIEYVVVRSILPVNSFIELLIQLSFDWNLDLDSSISAGVILSIKERLNECTMSLIRIWQRELQLD